MNKEVQAKWVAALRSGKYSQGQYLLHNSQKDYYCCLGVLSELAVEEGICSKIENINGSTLYGDISPELIAIIEAKLDYRGLNNDVEEAMLPQKVYNWIEVSDEEVPLKIYLNNNHINDINDLLAYDRALRVHEDAGGQYVIVPAYFLNDTLNLSFEAIADIIEQQ